MLNTLPPYRIFMLAAALVAAVLALVVLTALRQPWLGLSLERAEDTAMPPRIIAATGPSAAVPVGGELRALGRDGAPPVPLTSLDLTPEADASFARLSEMHAFFVRQGGLADILRAPGVTLHLGDGRAVRVEPDARRPLGDLPFTFWFQVVCGAAGALLGLAVWSYRRDAPNARCLALLGLGQLTFSCAAAIYSTRELALPASLFQFLSNANNTGALLFGAALASLAWLTPRPPSRFPFCRVAFAAYMLIALACALRLADDVGLMLKLPTLSAMLLALAVLAVQWFRVRRDPVDRATVRAFAFALSFGPTLFVSIVIAPPLVGIDSSHLQAYGFGLFLLVSIGVALCVARYRMFDLDRWWFGVWSVFGSGVLVVVLDLLFLQLLALGPTLSLALAMALAGWVYFPLRNRLWTRLMRLGGHRGQHLTDVLRHALGSAHAQQQPLWETTLRRLLAPTVIRPLPADGAFEHARVTANGAALHVPGIDGSPPLELFWADGGKRLFYPQDARDADTLRAVIATMAGYRRARAQGQRAERERIALDLQDDIGTRLSTLSRRSDTQTAEALDALQDEVRAVIHSLAQADRPLADSAARWRSEAMQRCEAACIPLQWHDALPATVRPLDALEQLALARILREALSNAIKHGAGRGVHVSLALASDQGRPLLRIDMYNPVAGNGTATASAPTGGLGLPGMRKRAADIGARLDMALTAQRARLRIELPLERAAATAPRPPGQSSSPT